MPNRRHKQPRISLTGDFYEYVEHNFKDRCSFLHDLGLLAIKKLMGIVEVDETFIGGKEKNKHKNQRKHGGTGGIGSGKIGVIGAISRKGNIVCRIIEDTAAETLEVFISETVSEKVTLVATDDYASRPNCRTTS